MANVSAKVKELAERVGLEFESHAPGDRYGIRYRFWLGGIGTGQQLSQWLLGSKEALIWLQGYTAGSRRG